MPLLSWDRVCLPKTLGGFSLLDLRLHNISLLLRWWWRLHHHPDTLWSKTARRLFGKRDSNLPPLAWNKKGSFLWNDMFSLRFYFQLSSISVVGNGLSTMFWYNSWGGTPLVYYNSDSKPVSRPCITVRGATPVWHDLLPAPLTSQQSHLFSVATDFNFTQQPDQVFCKWTTHGKYTASSTYKAFISSGKVLSPMRFLWKLKIPPSIKFFLLLLAHGRLLTQDKLLKRNIFCNQGCVLCAHTGCETASHLFFDCAFSIQLWTAIGFPQAGTLSNTGFELQDRLLALFATANNSARTMTLLATALWSLWLERNNRVFRNQSRRLGAIHQWIVNQATIFMKYS
ncbi:hypothetical protein LUZ63_005736 [Rhynchospora breviuscula]|uniref:Reverse transcriptase zinc-binding domain-containing protein n=1 Tax=Rhynchospora breviuscula TaxID=2022672 RepID=A0A9Q0CNE9_9POAL|nr:hypothetical protein LUZ63_005736 [Rhynchospora breviuscula]